MSQQERNPLNSAMSRRQALKLMGGLAGMATLAACAAPSAAPAAGGGEAAAPAGANPSLLVAHRREYFAEMETIFSDAVKAWGAENNVDIETTTVAAEANQDFVPKLMAEVQAGNPPNLVYHVRLVQLLHANNALEPVSDTVAELIDTYGEPAFGQKNAAQIDNEWYAIPYMMSGGGPYGRRSKFEEAGFDPLALETYEQRRDAALAMSDPSANFYGWGLTYNTGGDATGFIEHVVQSWGGHYTNEDVSEVTFNSPETIAAIEFIAEIYTSETYAPMIPPGVASWNDSSNNEAFVAGTIGYTNNSASIYAKAKDDGNPIFEDIVRLETAIGPTGEKLEAGGGGQFNIPRGAAHQDLAKQLTKYMLQPDIFLPISLISAGLFLPAYDAYYSMDEVVSAYEADPNLASMGRATLGTHVGASWPAQPNPLFDAINAQAVLTDMMAQIVAQGATVEGAVAQAHDRIITIGQEMGMFT
ncbi:MAG: extracellular solute-binding protein [Caldilineaceae bacterium]|nr:extracellular solute-binding protein [Caldilineaceae bacterium]